MLHPPLPHDARPGPGTSCRIEYQTGPERVPFFAIDSELLDLEFEGEQ